MFLLVKPIIKMPFKYKIFMYLNFHTHKNIYLIDFCNSYNNLSVNVIYFGQKAFFPSTF